MESQKTRGTPWYIKAKALMKNKNKTLQQLGDYLHMTPGGVGHYFSGRRQAHVPTIIKIAKFLEVPLIDLIAEDLDIARSDLERRALEAVRELDEPTQVQAIALLEAWIVARKLPQEARPD